MKTITIAEAERDLAAVLNRANNADVKTHAPR